MQLDHELQAYLAKHGCYAADREGTPRSVSADAWRAFEEELDAIPGEPEEPETARAKFPKKVTNGPRRSYRKGQENASLRRVFEKSKTTSAEGPSETHSPLSTTLQTTQTPPHLLRSYSPWEEQQAHEKLVAINRQVAAASNTPHVFSLNFSPAVIAKASAHSKGFLGKVGADVKRAIERAIGRKVPLVIVAGCARGRLHVHGTIACTEHDAPAIEKALTRIGGKWAAAHGERHQLKLEPLDRARLDVWGGYLAKNETEAKRARIAGPTWTCTNDVRSAARKAYEAERKEINAFRKSSKSTLTVKTKTCDTSSIKATCLSSKNKGRGGASFNHPTIRVGGHSGRSRKSDLHRHGPNARDDRASRVARFDHRGPGDHERDRAQLRTPLPGPSGSRQLPQPSTGARLVH